MGCWKISVSGFGLKASFQPIWVYNFGALDIFGDGDSLVHYAHVHHMRESSHLGWKQWCAWKNPIIDKIIILLSILILIIPHDTAFEKDIILPMSVTPTYSDN